MLPLPMPTDTALRAYLLCISRVPDGSSGKRRLLGLRDAVAGADGLYEAKARAAALHTLGSPQFTPGSAEDATEMKKCYTDRMASPGASGRPVYDKLRSAASRCPLCGHRDVTTLDHHLPKSSFPLLAVTPANLIPACSDCNKAKLGSSPTAAGEQTLHPYFDDVDQDVWLKAEVIPGPGPALAFHTDPPAHWPGVLAARLQHHFTVFRLAALYETQAAAELAGIAWELQVLHAVGGVQAVRDHLGRAAESRSKATRNSWQAATYHAPASSSWYCSGGFALT